MSLTGRPPGAGRRLRHPDRHPLPAETCADVAEAVSALRRIPVAQAYNLSLVDTTGACDGVRGPGTAPEVSLLRTAANHPLDREADSPTAAAVHSKERQRAASDLLLDHADDAERLGSGSRRRRCTTLTTPQAGARSTPPSWSPRAARSPTTGPAVVDVPVRRRDRRRDRAAVTAWGRARDIR